MRWDCPTPSRKRAWPLGCKAAGGRAAGQAHPSSGEQHLRCAQSPHRSLPAAGRDSDDGDRDRDDDGENGDDDGCDGGSDDDVEDEGHAAGDSHDEKSACYRP